jgi:flagellar hook-associated protein 3 FlgL
LRVTNQMIVDNAIRYMQENMARLEDLRNKSASGKRFQTSSEDPNAASAAMSLRSSLKEGQAFLDTARTTKAWMEATEIALKQVIELGTRALNKALDGFSDIHDASNREAFATEIDAILRQAIDFGNSRHLGNYIFSGFKTSTRPFTFQAGSPDSVAYNGDSGQIQRNLGAGQHVIANLDGNAALNPLFSSLISARDALFADDQAAISTAIEGLRTALASASLARTSNGSRQQQVEAVINQGEEMQLMLQGFLSQKEDVNMVEVISSLRQQETVYQATLEVTRRTLSTINLFDLLR